MALTNRNCYHRSFSNHNPRSFQIHVDQGKQIAWQYAKNDIIVTITLSSSFWSPSRRPFCKIRTLLSQRTDSLTGYRQHDSKTQLMRTFTISKVGKSAYDYHRYLFVCEVKMGLLYVWKVVQRKMKNLSSTIQYIGRSN